jgi:sugar phosphate isomerase/epimerase
MEIQFYCPRWGSEHLDWDTFCNKVKDVGYDGIEYAIARTVTEKELDTVWDLLTKHDLKIIAQHYDTYEADFGAHLKYYTQWLDKINPYPVEKINSQTGKDFYGFVLNEKIISAATRTRKSKQKVVHETHRNKFSFAAHVTKEYLTRNPGLRITLDVSHWVCVAESFLDDQQEAMELAIERTDHIHARVGYPESPQVSDPRIEEHQVALEKHLSWWDKVVERKKRQNEVLTISPEFGPHPYMVNVPGTGYPIADQWEINVWMMELLRERYRDNGL